MDAWKRITELREAKGWSVNRLANEAGITQSTLSAALKRGTQPSLDTLEQLCNALGVTLAEFFSPADEPEAASEEARPGDEWEPLAVRFEDGSIRPPEDLSPEQQAEIERLTKEFQEFLAWKLRKSNDHRD